jgi:hypothetical protein
MQTLLEGPLPTSAWQTAAGAAGGLALLAYGLAMVARDWLKRRNGGSR